MGLALFLISILSATADSTNNSSWFARPWRLEDGLPNNTVTGVAQTSDGFLWVSTPVGLARFDGIRFEEYSHTNYVADPNRGVIALAGSGPDVLWLAMDRGPLVRLKGGTATEFGVTNGLPDHTVHKLISDGDGGVWVAYRTGGIFRIGGDGTVTPYGNPPGVESGLSYSLATDTKGRLWLAAGSQLYILAAGTFKSVLQLDGSISCIAPAGSGGVWYCRGPKLFKFDTGGGGRDCGAFASAPAEPQATVMLEDDVGGVWIGTAYSGLYHFGEGGFEPVATSHRGITCLAEDREGNIWAGTSAGGLDRVRERVLELEGVESGLPIEAVQTISEGPDGRLWAATQNGQLVSRRDGRWTVIPIPGGGVTCVAADHEGGAWIGTGNRKLHHWLDGHLQTWGAAEGLEGRVLHSLLVSSTGDVWLGGPADVVQRLRAGQLQGMKLPAENGAVRTMVEDRAGNIWAGTARGLLFRITGDVVTAETAKISPRPLSIRSLCATPDGSLWVGFAGWGLGRLKDNAWYRLTTAQGLGDDFISQIVADDHGWLWCGGDHGIFRVSEQQIDDAAAGRAARVQSIIYGQGEGLPSLQAASGLSPGALRDRDGLLWMPMRTALAKINPSQLRDDREPPPVLISRVTLGGETVAWYGGVLPVPDNGAQTAMNLTSSGAELQLPPGRRRLEFEYTALSFKAPENVRFRYRLDGYDDDWTEADTQRKADYTSLPAGRYRFRVTACNSDGYWNDAGLSLNFIIEPFFWQTWWFRLAVVAVFTVMVAGVGRYVTLRRLRLKMEMLERQTALERERTRIARDIHDDLGAHLSEITILSELAVRDQGDPGKSGEHVRKISANVRQVIDSMDEIVWAVNPRNDTLPHLVSYTGQFAIEFLKMANIRCRLDLPDSPPDRILSAEVRHSLFLVVKEALNNVVRHSDATDAWLRITATATALTVVIEDNGAGFDHPPDDPRCDGLKNLRQRMEEIGGTCQIQSKKGAGTRVEFSYPWRTAI